MANLTATDRADGTGADFDITGVVGTATLYTAQYRGDVAKNPYVVQVATPTDGIQTVALANGSYSAVVVDGSGPAPPVGIRVTDGNEGIHFRFMEAVRDFVINMNLTSFPTDPSRFVTIKRPCNTFDELKAAVGEDIDGVFFWRRTESNPRIDLNTERIVEYPVEMVRIRSNKADKRPDDPWTGIRQQIIQAMAVQCPIPSVVEASIVNIRPGVLYDNMDSLNLDSQSLQFVAQVWLQGDFT